MHARDTFAWGERKKRAIVKVNSLQHVSRRHVNSNGHDAISRINRFLLRPHPRARQLEIYSVIHLQSYFMIIVRIINYRLIIVELLITIVLAVFLSWCVCNDVPSLCLVYVSHASPSLTHSLSLTPSRFAHSISHSSLALSLSLSLFHSRSFSTHGTRKL